MPIRSEVIVVWIVLLGASLVLLGAVAAVAWWQRRREVPPKEVRRAAQIEAERLVAEIAGRASAVAQRAAGLRQHADQAEAERSGALDGLEQAAQAHDRVARTHRELAQRVTERIAAAGGQRELEHAAFAAYRRGDLSAEQLWQVWRVGSGWTPELEKLEHQLAQLRVAWREAQLRYRATANRARAAGAAADAAEARERALAAEAAVVAEAAEMAPGIGMTP